MTWGIRLRRGHRGALEWITAILLLTCAGLAFGPALAQTPAERPAPASPSPDAAAYGALITVLEDDTARAQLLEELHRLADTAGAESPGTPATGGGARLLEATPGPGDALTVRLQELGTRVRQDLAGTWQVMSDLATGQEVPGVALKRWAPALESLAVAIMAVVVAYLTLRVVAHYGFKRLNGWILQEPSDRRPRMHRLRRLTAYGRGRKFVGMLVALALDLVASLLAGLAGYIVVIALTHKGAAVSLFAMQFLTAFVVVEAIKALSRGVFATRYDHLRLLPISSATAQYWNRWLVTIISITGYSLLLIVPLVQTLLTRSVGHLLGLLLMLFVYIYAVQVVWRHRHTVRDGLVHQAEKTQIAVLGTLIRILARVWHWLLLVYFTILFVVSQTAQQEALRFMATATARSALIVLIATALIIGISSLSARPMALPSRWHRSLPSLEARVNSYVPPVMRAIRLFVVVLAALLLLDAWHAFNLANWLTSPGGQAAIGVVVHVSIILLIAAMTWTVLASIIEHRLGTTHGPHLPSEREKTLLMLFRNAAAITIVTMTVLVVLSQIGINIGPLIAGAGVAGLAIGFGAQKLVQDVITGIFIQLENGMNQNDIVEVVGLFGTVEKITVRSVVIRTLDGGYHLIPFSAIDKVSNHTRGYGYHYAEYTIAHRESVAAAIDQMKAAFQALMQDPEIAPEVLEDISIPGVTSLNERGFSLRVMIKTTPGNQWAVQRAFNRLVKEHFDAAGIELPYPQTVLHFGRDKHGNAAPLDVRQVEKLQDAFDPESAPGQTRRPEPGGGSVIAPAES